MLLKNIIFLKIENKKYEQGSIFYRVFTHFYTEIFSDLCAICLNFLQNPGIIYFGPG
jgi:hypothetical protein